MRDDTSHIEKNRVNFRHRPSDASCGMNGCFVFPRNGVRLCCIVSDGMGWDHVSVTLTDKKGKTIKRTPTYKEMDFIKRLFWNPDEVVVQYHVAERDHLSIHDYCLHLWKKQEFEYPVPPGAMV